MLNGVVIYDVVMAENRILLNETNRRQQLQEARAGQGSTIARAGQKIQRFVESVRGVQADCFEQNELRERLAGC